MRDQAVLVETTILVDYLRGSDVAVSTRSATAPRIVILLYLGLREGFMESPEKAAGRSVSRLARKARWAFKALSTS